MDNINKANMFDNIWDKTSSKERDRLISKLQVRGIEPTRYDAFQYYMGWIKCFIHPHTGRPIHINPRKNKLLLKAMFPNKRVI